MHIVNVRTTATAKYPRKALFNSHNAPAEIGLLVLLYRRRLYLYRNWHLCAEVDCTNILYVPKVTVPILTFIDNVPKLAVPKTTCTESVCTETILYRKRRPYVKLLCNLTQGRIAAAHGWFSRIRPRGTMCTPYIESQK